MSKFKFFTNRKCTMWVRDNYYIEAKTKEEATKLIKSFINGSDCEISFIVREFLYDTEKEMNIKENEGEHTVELWDNEYNELLLINKPE